MKNIAYLKILAAGLVLVFGLSMLSSTKTTPNFTEQTQLKTFASENDVKEFLETQSSGSYFGGGMLRDTLATTQVTEQSAAPAVDAGKSSDYSTTNIQVEGVDEADFVKNDGKYIYMISGYEVVITDAYPAENAKILSTINLSGSNPQEIYINGDRLVVFGSVNNYYITPMMKGGFGIAEAGIATDAARSDEGEDITASPPTTGPSVDAKAVPAEERMIAPSIWPGPSYYDPTSYIKVYDITDRSNPLLKRDITLNGTYLNSRMVGNDVYAIVNVPAYNDRPIPVFSPYQRGFADIYYFPVPDYSYQFTNVLSLDINDDNKEMQNKVFLLGYSNSIYVSEENIYMVYQKQLDESYAYYKVLDEVYLPALPLEVAGEINSIKASGKSEYRKRGEIQLVINEWMQDNPQESSALMQNAQKKLEDINAEFDRERDKSVIHKISIKDGSINYVGKGEVPGMPLNQFSMDEHKGYFRIATTTNNWREEPKNNVYVLDGGMNLAGKLEDLAKGERIFSARFMGDRAYLVTFVRIDPLFVIDLSNPSEPKVLGELKIPGVSEYLHPYDENTIIGVGRSTEELTNRVTFSGIKISLFDVSDVANPVEKAKIEIGDQGTYSDALYDHKAFLFSKEKNLLVIPMTVYEKKAGEYYGSPVFNGAYAFNINANEITVKGRVTHATEKDMWNNAVRRSLYIDDVLYTISNGFIKASSLLDFSEIKSITLPQQYYYGPYYGGPMPLAVE